MNRATKAAELTATIHDGVRALLPLQLGFVAFCTYVAITVWNITDQQLIVPESVRLPLLDAQLPVKGFFLIVPWLIVILHFYVSIQLASLARKAWSFEGTVGSTESLQYLRELLPVSPLAQFFSGRYQVLSSIVIIGAFLVLPLLVLASIQIRFLCFHSEFVTWVDRLAVLTSCAVSIWLWPSLMTETGQAKDWWRETFRRMGVWARGARATSGAARGDHRTWSGIICVVICLLIAAVSIIALVPQSHHSKTDLSLERLLTIGWRPPVSVDVSEGAMRVTLWPTIRLFDAYFAPFSRNMRSPNLSPNPQQDRDLGGPSRAFVKALDLVGSRLVYVDLTGRDLRYANLSEARLPGAKLAQAKLFGANLHHADLRLADLVGADLSMSTLTGAHLEGANLRYAKLRGTSLTGAHLDGANLEGADLTAAQLLGASLRGANLRGANLQGVELFGAYLDGADLSEAKLVGARMHQAEMTAVNLKNAQMQGADLSSAKLSGATLNGAKLGGAFLNRADFRFVDFRGANGVGLDEKNSEQVSKEVQYWMPDSVFNQRQDSISELLKYLVRARKGGFNLNAAHPTTGCLSDDGAGLPCVTKLMTKSHRQRLNKHLLEAACKNEYTAIGVVARSGVPNPWPAYDYSDEARQKRDEAIMRTEISIARIDRDQHSESEFGLASLLLANIDNQKQCPGLTALSPEIFRKLRNRVLVEEGRDSDLPWF